MNEQKIDMVLDFLKEFRSEMRETTEKLEERIRYLEQVHQQQKGALALLTYLGLPASASIATFITRYLL